MRTLILTLSAVLFLASKNHAITINWDGGAGDGLWGSANNWNPNQVPTAADDVAIDLATITLNVANISLNSLTFSTGLSFLTGTSNISVANNMVYGFAVVNTIGDITIGGDLIWAGGNIIGPGSITVGGSLTYQPVGSFSGQCLNRKNLTASSGSWNSGTILVDNGGSFDILGDFTINISSSIGAYNGTPNGVFTVGGTCTVSSGIGATFVASLGGFISNGGISLPSSSSTMTINCNFTNNGLISGAGTLNANAGFAQNGSISPGLSNLTSPIIFYKLTSGTTNTYIELQGTTTPGVDYDKITVTTTGVLSGVLDISFLNGFIPSANDEFIIMTCSSCTGAFSSIVDPYNDPSAWEVTIPGGTQVKLKFLGVLPVELVDFQAFAEGETARLKWQTASETNNMGFHVQRRSAATPDWKDLAFVPGSGTSTAPEHYDFFDKNPVSGMSYYRLRQVDFDGQESYSGVVAVRLEGDQTSLQFYPNPATATLEVKGKDLTKGAIVRVMDATGKHWLEQPLQQGNTLDVSALPPGIYAVLLTGGDEAAPRMGRLVVQR
ncbi:MAG: T9SS type A sorting domain-containing protein [Saprospiraceae bacterium]|nr:T9SS type A sorting domain-containing protein [Saprospiraceae bacterium]